MSRPTGGIAIFSRCLVLLALSATASAANRDLSLALSVSPNPALAGETASYQLIATNHGSKPAREIVAVTPFPADARLVSSSSGCRAVSNRAKANAKVVCRARRLSAGASLSWSFGVRIGESGIMPRASMLRSSRRDSRPEDNHAAISNPASTNDEPTGPADASSGSGQEPVNTPPEGSPQASPAADRIAMPNLEANTKREYQPAAQAGETQAIAAGETSLAFDLYPAYRQDSTGNFAFSVLDVSQSLAMLAAGASGGTLSALLETSRAGLLEDRLHPAWDSFLLDLTNRHQAARLVASAAHWGQGTSQDHAGAHYLFESLFLDTLARNYGAELAAVDFTATPGNNQILSDAIHPWLAAHTQGRITYLASALGQNTRLVSASAWSLDGAWKTPPDASPAPEGRFELLDGTHVLTPMLGFSGEFAYAEGDGYRAFELPMAASDLALWVLMPEHDRFAKFRLAFSPDQMNGILAAMTPARKTLYLPKLAISSGLPDGAFATLNGGGAFTEGQADFSRINGEGYLYLDSLRHQTVVSLDEGAVKAAGATLTVHLGSKDEPDSVWSSHGSVVNTTPNFCDPVPHYDPSLALARPFLFAIRDQITGAILLMGQSTHPGGSPAAPDWTTDPCGFQIAPLGASPGLGG